MFCPECKAEYRPGFTRCADCEVDLVWELPSHGDHTELRTIWVGHDEPSCVNLCSQLKEKGIRYEVGRYVESRDTPGLWRYELAVPKLDASKARESLDLPETVVEENDEQDAEHEDQTSFELPAQDHEPPAERRPDSYLDTWYPEDATVEVWSGTASEQSLVEMSLKESRIRTRMNVLEDGSRKCFVLPEDEALARKIVHEIEEGLPDS